MFFCSLAKHDNKQKGCKYMVLLSVRLDIVVWRWCVHEFYLNARGSSSKKASTWLYLELGFDFCIFLSLAIWGLKKFRVCSVIYFYLIENCCYECSGVQSILCNFCSCLTHKGEMFNCCVMSKMHGRCGRLNWVPEEKMESFPAEMSSCLPISSAEAYLVGEGIIKSVCFHFLAFYCSW